MHFNDVSSTGSLYYMFTESEHIQILQSFIQQDKSPLPKGRNRISMDVFAMRRYLIQHMVVYGNRDVSGNKCLLFSFCVNRNIHARCPKNEILIFINIAFPSEYVFVYLQMLWNIFVNDCSAIGLCTEMHREGLAITNWHLCHKHKSYWSLNIYILLVYRYSMYPIEEQ